MSYSKTRKMKPPADVNGDGMITPAEFEVYNQTTPYEQALQLRSMGGHNSMPLHIPQQQPNYGMQTAQMNAMTRQGISHGFYPMQTRGGGWVNMANYHPDADWAPLYYARSTATYAFRRRGRFAQLMLMGMGVIFFAMNVIPWAWNANFAFNYRGPGNIEGTPGLEAYRDVISVD